MRTLVCAWFVFVLLLASGIVHARAVIWQTIELPGPQARYGHHYLVYLPPGYAADPARRWPLIVFLHGRGEWGDQIITARRHGLPRHLTRGHDIEAIVVVPQTPAEQYWHPLFIDAVMQDAASRYRIDTTRTYLTGLSMGGIGSWNMAVAFPQRFAALAPVAGCLMNDIATAQTGYPQPLDGAYTRFLQPLRSLPTWVFHGDRDYVVDTELGQRSTQLLRGVGGSPRETIYPMTDHDSWTPTYEENPDFYTWLMAQSRPDARWDVERPRLEMARYAGRYFDEHGDLRAEVMTGGEHLRVRWVREDREEELLALSPTEFVGTGLVRFVASGPGHMRGIEYLGFGEAVWKAD